MILNLELLGGCSDKVFIFQDLDQEKHRAEMLSET